MPALHDQLIHGVVDLAILNTASPYLANIESTPLLSESLCAQLPVIPTPGLAISPSTSMILPTYR